MRNFSFELTEVFCSFTWFQCQLESLMWIPEDSGHKVKTQGNGSASFVSQEAGSPYSAYSYHLSYTIQTYNKQWV